jgi:hypothetical protein
MNDLASVPPLPDYLRNADHGHRRMIDVLGETLGAGSVPYLSIAGGAFTLKNSMGAQRIGAMDPTVGLYIDVCIMDQNEHMSKIFYEEDFQAGQTEYKPPECFSHNGIGPSIQSAKPQARTCAECQWFAWNSAISSFSGKGVKACADAQMLALMFPDDNQIWLLRVPPNSLKNLKNYRESLVRMTGDMRDLVTRIWFEQGKIGSLKFQAVSYLDEKSAAIRNQLLKARLTDTVVGRNDKPRPADAALPPPVQPQPAPVQSQAFLSAQPAPVQPQAFLPQAPQQAAAAEPPKQTRRRRNTAQVPQNVAPAQENSPVAPFMQPQQGFAPSAPPAQHQPAAPAFGAPAGPPVAPQGPAGGAPFGMATPGAPNADIAAAISSVVGPRQ